MSPGQLLEKLENLGIIDAKILDKIRKEIENPEKTVKPSAVLKYLVKKKQITESQATLLLKSDPKPEPKADEFEFAEPEEKDYDTDDLTGGLNEYTKEPEVEPPPPAKPDHGATIIDDGQLAEVEPEIIVDAAFDPVELDEIEEVAPTEFADDAGLADAGFGGEGMDSGAYETQSGQQHVLSSFKGKRSQGDQWSTKWLYIAFGILGTLIIGIGITYIATMGQAPEDMFEAAMNSFNQQSYSDAAKKFEEYLEDYPKHKDAPTARARRIHSIIRATYGMKNWPEVIQQANTLLPELAEDEDSKIDLLREDLAVMLPRSLVEISRKATNTTAVDDMENELTVINGYKQVVDNPVYIPASKRKPTSIADNYARIDNNIRTLVGQIDKEKDYKAALIEIKTKGEAGETDGAFATFQKLTRNYGDLGQREKLLELMLTISKKEQELVAPISVDLKAFDVEPPTLLQSSVVLAAKTGKPVESLKDEIVSFLADGSVFGIDAGTGSLVWRRFVGYETSIQPVAIDAETLAVSDQRNQELISLDQDTGQIKWRTEIKEPFLAPTVGDQMMVVTTESGKVIQINAANGEIEKSIQLPQPANVNAMVATKDPYIYQVGSYSNIYVLSSLDYSCTEVFYLGHYKGSIVVPPQAWAGYILVAVNGGDHCNLHVLKPESNGLGLKLVQVISRITDGPVSMPLQRFGRWMLMTSDNGEMRILELYPNEDQNPVRILTSDRFDAKGGQQAFLNTEGSNLWVAGQGIIRYRIQRNLGKFGREVIVEPNDTFISPIHKLDDYLLHVRRRNRSGMISASLVDAMTLKPVWRTDLGGELAGPPILSGDTVVAVNNQGDLFTIDAETETNRYSDSPVRSSTVIEDLKFNRLIELGDNKFACVGPADRQDLLYADSSTGKTKLVTLAKPADKPACQPIAIDGDLIIPSASGQIARVDPNTGRMVGTPFQPPIKPGSVTDWFEPTMLGNNLFAVASGASDDGTKSMLYLLNGADRSAVKQVDALELEFPIKSRLINDGSNIMAVVASESGDNLAVISGKKPLTIGQQANLEGELAAGPWMTKAGIIVLLDNDKLYCFGDDLAPKWSIKMSNDQLACPPEIVGAQLMVCFRNGKVNLLDPTTGKGVMDFDVGQPIMHRPFRAGQKMYFGGMDGTVHVLDLSRISQP